MSTQTVFENEQAAQRERDWVAFGEEQVTLEYAPPTELASRQRQIIRKAWAITLLLEAMGVEL